MGTLGRVRLTYEETDLTEFSSNFFTKVAGFVEFLDGESIKPIEFALLSQFFGETNYDYPKLFSVTLMSVFLLDDLPNLGINETLMNETNGILPKLGSRKTIYIKIVDYESLIGFDEGSREIVENIAHSLSQHTVSLNLTQTQDIKSNSTIKGKYIYIYK